MAIFFKKLFLKFFWWFIFSILYVLSIAIFDIKQFGFMLSIWLIFTIYIIFKKVDLSEENKNLFVLKFFSYSPYLSLRKGKSQEVKEVEEVKITKIKKSFLSKFFSWVSSYMNNLNIKIEQEKQRQLKKQEEEDLKITNMINQIHDGNYSIDVPIRLNNSEKAYFFIIGAEWHEIRSSMKSVSYGHLSHTFKIGKGVNFKIGNIKPIPHKKSEFTKIADGDFYITNERIMLVSSSETKKINLSSILNVSIFRDGVLLQKDSGKSVFIPMNQNKAIIAKAIIDNA